MPPKPDDERLTIGRRSKKRGRNIPPTSPSTSAVPASPLSSARQAQDPDWKSRAKDSLPVAWPGLELLLKKVEGCLDGTPFKVPVGALNTLIRIEDAIVNTNDPLKKRAFQTLERLEVVNAAVDKAESDAVVARMLTFAKKLRQEAIMLNNMSSKSTWVKILEKEEHRKTIEESFTRIDEATKNFQLHVAWSIERRTNGVAPPLPPKNEISVFNGSTNTQFINSTLTIQQTQITLAEPRRSAALLPLDTDTRQQIPLKPEIFHGRDGLCEEIAQLLTKEETSRVCILGPGGMGKTSVSLAVVELPLVKDRFSPGNCVWVPCIEATSATLLLEILYVQLQVPGDKQVTLEKIISELDSSKQPHLILLDNFETPWNAPGGTQKQVSDILRKLAILSHVAILVTMRGTYPPCDAIGWQSQTIQPTDEAACRRIFYDINPSWKYDPDIGRLLGVLGHMPFAVTLMANLGKRGKSTVKELLDAWYKRGPDILEDQHEESMNRSISLSVDSNLVKRNPNALHLLKILSLLPAGTTKENLRWWAPSLDISMTPSAIATLSNAALLVENKRQDSNSPVLFVLPVVQSFMQQHDRIAEEIRKQAHSSCCQYVLDHTCRYNNSTFPAKSKVLAAEDTNIQSILLGLPKIQLSVSSDRTMRALIAFSWHRCDTKPNPEIANYAVMVAKASGNERYIASAMWCLGRTYHQLGNYHLSCNYLQEAYQLFNTLPPVDLKSQQLGGQCGIDLVDAARLALEDKGRAVSLARDVEMKCATLSDDLVHGRSLVYLGVALIVAQQQQEALVHLDRARAMLKAVGNTPDLAEACQNIAHVHYHERRLPEALEAIKEAWRLAELSGSPAIQADISLEFSRILFSANRDTEAWKYMEIGLMKASHIGNRLAIAQALQDMGYGYLRRGDYQNAYGAYEAAAEKYLGTIGAWVEKRCKDNMAGILQKQMNPDAVVGFYRHYLDVDPSLFYPPVQASASNVPISGS